MCWRYWSHPARRAQLRPEEATGFGRVPTLPGWRRHPRSWRFFPREAELPGHSAGWQRAPGASPERRSCRLSFLGRGVVSLLSACFRQASLRHSRGTGGSSLAPWEHMGASVDQQAGPGGMPSNAALFFAIQYLGALVSPISAETNSRIQSHPSLGGSLPEWPAK